MPKTKGRFRACLRSCLPRHPQEDSFDDTVPDYYKESSYSSEKNVPSPKNTPLLEPPRSPVSTPISPEPAPESPCEAIYFPDKFVGSLQVFSLNQRNFEGFLKKKDATLVMFYNRKKDDSSNLAEQFAVAANCTKRANHAFAAVDCGKEESLCNQNAATTFPMFTLYARSKVVTCIRDLSHFNTDMMRKYVEQAPPYSMI